MGKEKNVRLGKGHGFLTEDGKLFLERCFSCGMENHSMTVSTGGCAWCGANGYDSLDKKTCGFCDEPCNNDHCVTKKEET